MALEGLLNHPGFRLLVDHFHDVAEGAHAEAMGDGGQVDRARADAALRWRTTRQVVMWPQEQLQMIYERTNDG